MMDLTNEKRELYLEGEYVNIAQRGCIGDGITDNTSLLQSILNECAESGKIVFIPKGIFITGELKIPDNTYIKGEVLGELKLKSGREYILYVGENVNATIKDIRLTGNNPVEFNTVAGTEKGIKMEKCQRVLLENLLISGFNATGIHVTEVGYNSQSHYYRNIHIDNVRCEKNYYGLYIGPRGEYLQVVNSSFGGNNIGCFNGGGNNIFSNCAFNRNQHGFHLRGGSGYPNNTHASASSCQFNHNRGDSLRATNVDVGFMFTGCQFYDGLLTLENCVGVVINASEGGTWRLNATGAKDKNLMTACFFYQGFSADNNDGTLILNNNIYR